MFNLAKRKLGFDRPVIDGAPAECMNCRGTDAVFVNKDCTPDFKPHDFLSEVLAKKFLSKWNGICSRCGLFQNYNRYSAEEINEFCAQMISKDRAVSEEAFHSYPVPEDFVKTFDDNYFGKRLLKWDAYIRENNLDIKRCLFLRPMFGAAPSFIKSVSPNCEISAVEISDVCQKTTSDRCEGITFLNGNIHGWFSGEFLEARDLDAIFVVHTLVHCVDIHDSLNKLCSMLRPGGRIFFTHEVISKPSNPFHVSYTTEWTLTSMLYQHFGRVDRIDDCEDIAMPAVNRFTKKNDNPDLVAMRTPALF